MIDNRHDRPGAQGVERGAAEAGQTGHVPRVEFNLAVDSEPTRPLSVPELPEPGSATGMIPVSHHATSGHRSGERYGESRDRAKDADDSVNGSAVRTPKEPGASAGEANFDTQPAPAR